MADQHDYQALDWVKGEIEETLKQAQQSLEAFVENPEDSTQMRFCLTHLHQVTGTLQMVEFYGAALLAEEMENLAIAIMNGKVQRLQDGQEELMKAILQLPLYLDRVKEGQSDVPVAVLPLLNDLRAACGDSLLSETALFKPDLEAGGEAAPKDPLPGEALAQMPELLKKVRQLYQFALVGLIRNQDLPSNLGYMAKSLSKLEQLYSSTPMAQLWWVAAAMMEGVSKNSIELGTSVKMLLGQLDRQLKKSLDSGARRDERVPVDLLKNLLYYVSRAESGSLRIDKVKEAFKLDSALPSEELLDMDRQRLAGPDKDAIISVVKVLLEELGIVKDALDLFMRGQMREAHELRNVIPNLKQISDTLAVLGLGNPRRVILEQIDCIGKLAETNVDSDDSHLMDVAGALLYVEATLKGMARDPSGITGNQPGNDQEDNKEFISPDQFNRARMAVIEESRSGLDNAKDAISEYIASDFDVDNLEPVPDILHSVQGGLMMVPLAQAASQLQSCSRYIKEKLIVGHAQPDPKELDLLADAITSVEYYLERLGDQNPANDDILAIAEDALISLGYPPQEIDINEIEVLSDNIDVEQNATHSNEIELIQEEGELEWVAEDETVDRPEINLDVESEFDMAPAISEQEPEAEDDDELIDEEVIEIFIEEAGEVLETIHENLPVWKSDYSNEGSVKELRRAYHTLKGSGRMVGALVIGELAWSVENMLNRALDNTIETTPRVIDIVERVAAVVPDLVTAFEKRVKPTINVDALAAVSDALSKGEEPPPIPNDLSLSAKQEVAPEVIQEILPEEQIEEIPESDDFDELILDELPESEETISLIPEVETEAMASESEFVSGVEMDPVLIDIFSQEASSHLDIIKNYLEAPEEKVLNDSLLRSLHTLKGSAYMAGIKSIALLATPTERFIKECHLQGVGIDPDIQAMLSNFVELIDSGLVGLKDHPSAMINGSNELLNVIEALREDKLKHVHEEKRAAGQPDPQLVSLFLSEGMDLIVDAGDVLRHWEQNPVPGEELDQIRQELRILARSASAAQLPELVDLCMTMEELYNQAADGMITPNAEFFRSTHKAHESLVNMMDFIAAGQPLVPADSIIQELQGLMDQAPQVSEQLENAQQHAADHASEVMADELEEDSAFELDVQDDEGEKAVDSEDDFSLEAEVELTVDEPADEAYQFEEIEELEEDAPVVQTNIVDEQHSDYDPELVEIFLEEAAEILDATAEQLHAWMGQPDDLKIVTELQRSLHTLKGGARMSDMKEMGDLGHNLENLYEGLCMRTFKATPALFDLLHQCHDRLASMFDVIQSGQTPAAADDLIVRIDDFMHGRLESDTTQVSQVPSKEEEPDTISVPEFQSDDLSTLQAGGEDVDIEILEIFLEEAEELAEGIDNTITAWLSERENLEHLQEMKRLLHTLKGGARLAGLVNIGNMSHNFESYLIQSEVDRVSLNDAFFNRVQQQHDTLMERLDQLRKQGSDLISAVAQEGEFEFTQEEADAPVPVMASPQPIDGDTREVESSKVVPITAKAKVVEKPEQDLLPASAFHTEDAKRSSNESVKVAADLMEDLVNLAGETSIIRGRIEQELTDFNFVMDEISVAIVRARELLRRLDIETEAQILHRYQQAQTEGVEYEDFDPLEMDRYSTLNQLSRSLSETVSDLTDLRDSLVDRSRDAETLLVQQGRINSELQENLMRTRMVPFSRMTPRLRRIVRQIAGELGKKAELEIIGAEGEMDRTVLERMVPPLEHMLRNAVDHGLEMPNQRLAAGKKDVGRITIHLAREGGEVVLRLSDDGKGISLGNVKKRAIERGLMKADSPLSDKEIMQFIFKPGFSTAEKVTQISGRGVGMDVVHSEIKQLGGSVKLHSAPGAGSQFTVRLPFTVSVNRALMVRVGEDHYAIPLNNIEGIVRVSPYELDAYYQPDAPKFEYAGQQYNVRYLGRYVHNISVPNLSGHTKALPVLLVRGADHSVALQVDSLVGSREIVVKSVGPQLAAVSGISGATILGDGSVVIILDLNAVIRAEQAQADAEGSIDYEDENRIETEVDVTPIVMVVDDSVTVRKVTGRLLERNGYEVVTAKDGVDAITQLQEIKPHVMLLDIEMPRMDGFEVATLVRHDDRLQDTPIIMITSRTGDKHRDRAMSIGVNRYLGKPYQESILLQNIEELIK